MFDIKKILIPDSAGCYIMKDQEGKILYIGKAKNLKKRVTSYFRGSHDSKTNLLVKKVSNIEFIITDNEVEALVLEAKLIFTNKPPFNIDLKESVRYAYIKISNENFPKIISTREIDRKKDEFYGPYPDGSARRETVYLLNKIFKLRVCKKMPKHACLLYHIGQCTAPCEQRITTAEYKKNLDRAKMVLKGKIENLISILNSEMSRLSSDRAYEQAKVIRDQIFSLRSISKHQKVSLKKRYNQDFIHFAPNDEKLHIQLFNIDKGLLSGRKQFEFLLDRTLEPESQFVQFVAQYYFTNEIPEEVVTEIDKNSAILLSGYLSKIKNAQVKITIPQKGTKRELLLMLKNNLAIGLDESHQLLLEVKNTLLLQTLPRNIECFDISNIGSSYSVGSMVHFTNGKPDKKNYRKFKIKTVTGQNDYAMMAEIVLRRYQRLIEKKEPLPDLIIIDGGPGQLNAAFFELQKLKLSIPLISIAKKEELIYSIGQDIPLSIARSSKVLKLIQHCRDEAHRFGVSYHRLLRSKGMRG